MIICQHCRAQTDDGAIFCDVCGQELAPLPQPGGNTPQPPLDARRTAAPSVATPADSRQTPLQAPAPSYGLPVAAAVQPPAAIILRLANGQRFTLRGKTEYIVGRIGTGHHQPDVDLARFYGFEAGVSREHIKIHVRPDGVYVEDLKSLNETVQNGYRLMPEQLYPLHEGDQLRLGGITLVVSFE